MANGQPQGALLQLHLQVYLRQRRSLHPHLYHHLHLYHLALVPVDRYHHQHLYHLVPVPVHRGLHQHLYRHLHLYRLALRTARLLLCRQVHLLQQGLFILLLQNQGEMQHLMLPQLLREVFGLILPLEQ